MAAPFRRGRVRLFIRFISDIDVSTTAMGSQTGIAHLWCARNFEIKHPSPMGWAKESRTVGPKDGAVVGLKSEIQFWK